MFFAAIRRRILRRLGTLRLRLLVWNSLVLILASVFLLIGVRTSLHFTLLAEVDELLREDTEQVRLAVRAFANDPKALRAETDRQVESHKQRDLFISLFDKNGNRIWRSGIAPKELDGQPLRRRWSIPYGAGDHRVVEETLSEPMGTVVSVRVGTSASYVYSDIARLTRTMLVALAIMVVVAPLGGYWLAWRATRPLAEMIATARRLRPAQLDERLRVLGTHDELDLLAETVNGMLDRIADYITRHREFIADAAHELRSPLTALRSTAEVTLGSDRDPSEYKEVLGDIIDCIDSLTYLVNQLLLLAETEKKTERDTEWELVRIDRRVEHSIAMFAAVAEVQGVTLRCLEMAPTTIRGVPHHLDQLINNLIDNALKFTHSGGKITVRLLSGLPFPATLPTSGLLFGEQNVISRSLEFPDEKWACLEIADTGQGIATADLPHIFDRFFRVDKARTRDQVRNSTGLGLSICKAIVTSHSGVILAESKPGQGTTFTVWLPLAEHMVLDLAPTPMFA